MKYEASSPEEYIKQLPEDRKAPIMKLRTIILDNIPEGFEETMSYGMIGYVVPHSIYPKGYHCSPEQPLPFLNIASQKNFVAVYSSAMYANPEIYSWFTAEYPKYCKYKMNMGKSCIRFKKMEDIPYNLIGELVKKMSMKDWIELYESKIKKGI